jgi:hypothetical protein
MKVIGSFAEKMPQDLQREYCFDLIALYEPFKSLMPITAAWPFTYKLLNVVFKK